MSGFQRIQIERAYEAINANAAEYLSPESSFALSQSS